METRDGGARPESGTGSVPETAVVEFVTSLPAGRALDLGCGGGRHALWLAVRAWQVTAVDVSTETLRGAFDAASHLPRASRDRLTWVNADVTNIGFRPEYDLVLACDVAPDAGSGYPWVRRVAEALVPGGTLIARLDTTGPEAVGFSEKTYTARELEENLGDILTILATREYDRDIRTEPAGHESPTPRGHLLVVGVRRPVGN